ncbi:hypothetical protein Trydic_g16445 [Trypoxylus dichotomus]
MQDRGCTAGPTELLSELVSCSSLLVTSNHLCRGGGHISFQLAMENDMDKYLQVALEITKRAGKLILERTYKEKTVETKSVEGLSQHFPDHKFIGEETASSGKQSTLTQAPTWIIDPIDGTMNFVHGFPHSCISVALFISSEPAVAIIYNPLQQQLFTAVKNKGAFLNDQRIRVSGEKSLSNALIMFECGTSRDPERLDVLYKNFQLLVPQVHGIRSLGSAALNMAMVAMGGADAGFEYGIHIWDIAAGELIITEAGGIVIDPSGGPIDRCSRRVLCASSESLAKQLSEKLVQFHPSPRD